MLDPEEIARRLRLCEKAAEHMRYALSLLDLADVAHAAALLDQALHAVPGVPWNGTEVPGELPSVFDVADGARQQDPI